MLTRQIRSRRTCKRRFRSDDFVEIAPTLAEEEEYELVKELKTLAARLGRNDPELRRVELLPRPRRCSTLLGSFWLENELVCQALQECWRALRGNRQVRHLVLKALPEVELRMALRDAVALQDLQHLWIQHTLPSQSLSCDDPLRSALLTAHMPIPSLQRTGLQSLCLDVRLTVDTQAQLDALSSDFRLLTQLRHVQLHLVPQCSMQYPTLSMQSLLQTFADLANSQHQKLTTLQLTLGCAQNPFQQPLIQNAGVLELLLSSGSSLERLHLDNFGFRNEHLRVVTRALETNTKLQHLQFAAHVGSAFSVPAVQTLCEMLQQRSNVTLQSCSVVMASPPIDGAIRSHHSTQQQQQLHPTATELQWQQEHVNLWCFLNRLRKETLSVVGRTQQWWDMIFRVDESVSIRTSLSTDPAAATASKPLRRRRRRNEQQQQHQRSRSPRTLPISVLLFELDRDEDDNLPPPPPSVEQMARNRCALGAIYALVRSHPQNIVTASAAVSQVVALATSLTQSDEAATTSPTTTPSSSPLLQVAETEASTSDNIDDEDNSSIFTNNLQEYVHGTSHPVRSDTGHRVTPQSTHHHLLDNHNKACRTVARSLELD